MGTPQLSQKALEQVIALTKINQRFRDIDGQRPEQYGELLQIAQARFEKCIMPVLQEYVQHYPEIKKEVDYFLEHVCNRK